MVKSQSDVSKQMGIMSKQDNLGGSAEKGHTDK